MSFANEKSVIVVGGGVIGAASAHYLRQRGWRVTLVESGKFGAGCSHGNCGFVSPSHVLPLAEPGAVWKTLKGLCRSNSPFYIKPRFDPALWRWLLSFARHCNQRDMLHGAHALHALLQSSSALYAALARNSLACEYERKGLLFVYQHSKYFEKFAAVNQLLSETFKLPAKKMSGDEVTAFEPALKSGLAGGWFYECDAHLRPDRLMTSWRARLEADGVTILENTQALDLRHAPESRKAVALRTNKGEIVADAFVFALGAMTPMFASLIGCRIPIQPGKGYSLTMPRPNICPAVPLIFSEHKVAITPFQSGYRIGSTMEFSGYDATLNQRRLKLLKSGAEIYLREPYCEPLEEAWTGWRPMTPDSLPVIDFSPRFSNLVVAAGHGMLGISMAPGTGKLVAELLSGEPPHINIEPFKLARF